MTLPRLIDAESPEAAVLAKLERRWLREFGGNSMPWNEAWLWGISGYATFEQHFHLPLPGTPRWCLNIVWLAPELRRHGLLTEAWPMWLERYGEFDVAAPNEAMQAFLDRLGT